MEDAWAGLLAPRSALLLCGGVQVPTDAWPVP